LVDDVEDGSRGGLVLLKDKDMIFKKVLKRNSKFIQDRMRLKEVKD